MSKHIKDVFVKWWEGDVTMYPSPIIGFHVKRHWTARAVSVAIALFCNEWKWIATSLIAIAGIYFAFIKK